MELEIDDRPWVMPDKYKNMTVEEIDEEIARLEKEYKERKKREAEAKNK